jgi:hypothetical protein
VGKEIGLALLSCFDLMLSSKQSGRLEFGIPVDVRDQCMNLLVANIPFVQVKQASSKHHHCSTNKTKGDHE